MLDLCYFKEYVPALPGNLLCWDFEADVNFDFLLKQGDLYVTDRGSKVKFGTITMTDELRKLDDGCIITCFYSDHQWIFKKRRYDRKHPNGLRAANGMLLEDIFTFTFIPRPSVFR